MYFGYTSAASAPASAAAAASVATAAADKTKMCASSLIFRAIKWCFSSALGGSTPPATPHQKGFAPWTPHKGRCLLTPPDTCSPLDTRQGVKPQK